MRCRPSSTRSRSVRNALVSLALASLVPGPALAQANGKLQIHHMKVGQGDGMLLVTPQGQTALFDDGVYTNCTYIKSYLQGLGITTVDYHFASHYHADHIGCIDDLAAIGIMVGTAGYDRGYSYSSATFTTYVNTLGAKRATIAAGQVITLDAGAANPVYIRCVNLNGAGVYSPTGGDENAKSVVLAVSYGAFDEVIGGDLTGSTAQGNDVETTVGPQVGDVEVYKVHHHGSRYSTNDNWLNATTPEVAIIQVGSNSYGHPTSDALTRLHAHNVKTYWTESGSGAAPDAQWDKVANETILVQADPGTSQGYTVSGPGFADTYPNGGSLPPATETVVASAVTLAFGTITGGSVASLAVDDGADLAIAATKNSGKWQTDWYGTIVLNHTPLDLTVTYDGGYSVSRTQTMSIWNWSTSTWTQVSSGTVGTADVTQSWSASSPASYVSAANEVRVRILANKRSSTYTCYGDYMAVSYSYPQSLAPDVASTASPRADEPASDTEASGLPLSVLARIEARHEPEGVVLAWATDLDAHADGFNVYRQEASGARTSLGGESAVQVGGGEVRFRFVDAAPAPAGSYWLGVRGCAGPEALIGPVHVAAGRAVTLAFAAQPNPARGRASFAVTLGERGPVSLEVYDVAGRRVAEVFRGDLPPGGHTFGWEPRSGAGVAAGVYFAKLQTPTQARVARLVFVGR